MLFRWLLGCTLLSIGLVSTADEPLFSGPQVGEAFPPLPVKLVLRDDDAADIDFVKATNNKPLLVIFFHKRTRPAYYLTRKVMEFGATKREAGLRSLVVFLTDDPTETNEWVHKIQKQLPKGVDYAISYDGIEGPGTYGLNRNVTLTVLVGDQGNVTANVALIQPQMQADGPKIMKAIVDVTGGGEVPELETDRRMRP